MAQTSAGHRISCLTPCPPLSGQRAARELDRVIAERGMPKTIVSERALCAIGSSTMASGTEFTSMAIFKWVQETGVDWYYIAPGKPQQNGLIESFNGKLRPSRACKHAPPGSG